MNVQLLPIILWLSLCIPCSIMASIENNSSTTISNQILVDSIFHPDSDGNQIYFYRSTQRYTSAPTIFFCPGIGENNPQTYQNIIDYVLAQQVNLCYLSYGALSPGAFPRLTYNSFWRGICAAQNKWRNYLDSTKIGFVGHSYGGGMTSYVAWRAVKKKSWGTNGIFIYAMAPWYCHKMSALRWNDFPPHTILVTQVFENDRINDFRIAEDIFNSIKISNERKCFITVMNGSHQGKDLLVDHSLPCRKNQSKSNIIVNPVIDSLIFYSFTESYRTQLGRKREALKQSVVSSGQGGKYAFIKGNRCPLNTSQSEFLNFWDHAINPQDKSTQWIPPPLRMCLKTPQTAAHYALWGLKAIFNP